MLTYGEAGDAAVVSSSLITCQPPKKKYIIFEFKLSGFSCTYA